MIAYAITDSTSHLEKISKKSNMVLYRNRDISPSQYVDSAKLFVSEAKNYKFDKVLVHGDIDLASLLKVGVHLTSLQFDKIKTAKFLGLFTVISTHTLAEVKEAEKLGADMITFSPIFKTPNKGEPKGLGALREIVSRVNIPVIALGGVLTDEQIEGCLESGAKGFASIRYFL